MTIAERQALTPDLPQPHRFTRDEYYRLADLGLFQHQRVELIAGEIVDMSPPKDTHAITLGLVIRAMERAFPAHWVRPQLPLSFAADSEPEPDIAVVRGVPRDYLGIGHHPEMAMLVIEIADTSLLYDRKAKAEIYAAASIADYWIINLRDRCIEVHRDPVAEPSAPPTHRYQTVPVLKAPAAICPLASPSTAVPVADLLT